jgi:hypothetical protein
MKKSITLIITTILIFINLTFACNVSSSPLSTSLPLSSSITSEPSNTIQTAPLQPPIISQIISTNITNTTACISWLTDKPATGQVEYGISTDYGLTSSIDKQLTKQHQVTFNGLTEDITYHFKVKSTDSQGMENASEDNIFDTKIIIGLWFSPNASVKGITLLCPHNWKKTYGKENTTLKDMETCDGTNALISIFPLSNEKNASEIINRLKAFTKTVKGYTYTMVYEKDITINSFSGREILWEVTGGNSSENEQWLFLITNNEIYYFVYSSSQLCWPKYKPIFDEIISSLQIVM